MASPRFVQAAQRSTEVVHQQLQTVLSGRSSAVTIEGANAVLDLAPFIEAAKQRLVASGFAAAARIPEIHPTVELFPASYLVQAQTAYRALDAAAPGCRGSRCSSWSAACCWPGGDAAR